MRGALVFTLSSLAIACSKPEAPGPAQAPAHETKTSVAGEDDEKPYASPTSGAPEQEPERTPESAPTCESDADCSTCSGPQCSCLLAPESGKCTPTEEQCFADPCMRHEARCDPATKTCKLVQKEPKAGAG